MAKYTLASFLEKAQCVHGDTYDYSNVVIDTLTNSKSKVEILCKTHGSFTPTVNAHLYGKTGCPSCGATGRYTLLKFMTLAREVHGDRYDYSGLIWPEKVNYRSQVTITCNDHGPFTQSLNGHINNGAGCPTCVGNRRYTPDIFLQRAHQIHSGKYQYPDVTHSKLTAFSTVNIVCPLHGEFKQTINNHINHATGCVRCKSSRGEKSISTYLECKNIKYNQQHKFADCQNPVTGKMLPFDFWLPEHNLCIEFHGKQHYEPSNFGSIPNKVLEQTNLVAQQYRDSIKEKFCQDSGIKLIVIPYTDITKIDDVLSRILGLVHNPM